MMKVSAIVSAYKSDEFLEGCFEDLVTQSIPIEIVVIANDVSDKERKIIEHYKSLFPTRFLHVEYVEKESIYASWNRAIKLASGEYITNANVDDRHQRDYMKRMS